MDHGSAHDAPDGARGAPMSLTGGGAGATGAAPSAGDAGPAGDAAGTDMAGAVLGAGGGAAAGVPAGGVLGVLGHTGGGGVGDGGGSGPAKASPQGLAALDGFSLDAGGGAAGLGGETGVSGGSGGALGLQSVLGDSTLAGAAGAAAGGPGEPGWDAERALAGAGGGAASAADAARAARPGEPGRSVIADFLRAQTCYDAIPESCKVVVFDSAVPLKLAFYAFVEHDLRAAPVWASHAADFDGVLTVSDFIDVMRFYHERDNLHMTFAEHTIESWRAMTAGDTGLSHRPAPVGSISVDPETSLFDACRYLHAHSIHRLPVVDPAENSCLSVLTHWNMLRYLVTNFREERRLFDESIRDLGIGEHGPDVTATVPLTMPLIQVLDMMIARGESAVPLVDLSSGAVMDVWSRRDVTYLARDPSLETLNLPVGEVRRQQIVAGAASDLLHTASGDDSLHAIIEKFATTQAHWFVLVDAEDRCVGKVTIADLFQYFVSDDGADGSEGAHDILAHDSPGVDDGDDLEGDGGGGVDGDDDGGDGDGSLDGLMAEAASDGGGVEVDGVTLGLAPEGGDGAMDGALRSDTGAAVGGDRDADADAGAASGTPGASDAAMGDDA